MKKDRPQMKNASEMAGRMYRFFISYDDRGVPSFEKFAKSVGITVSDLESLRRRKRFDRAYRECQEIRRDYLIDRALDRRFDPSFVKFLLSSDIEECESETGELTLRLEVSE